MAFRELYVVSNPLAFAGVETDYSSAVYTVLGVPFDSTSSYVPGSRFAPTSIREASASIESNSLMGMDSFIEDARIADLGDLAVVHGDPRATLERVARVVSELASDGKIPIILGGEHTITAGVIRGLVDAGRRPCLVVFDAHLDLRDEYLGLRYSHACAIRRALEYVPTAKIAFVGVRAYSRDEAEYVERAGSDRIKVFGSLTMARLGPANVAGRILNHLSSCSEIYVSFDIDAIDPSEAPGTGTPEPLGLRASEALSTLVRLIDDRLIGFDLVEVNPLVDHSRVTSVLAARMVQEAILAHMEKSKRSRG